jgi:DNA-binding response OmpR family regulator
MNILAVDDEKDTRDFLRNLLTRETYRVSTASSALQAMALVQLERFDLVLVDLMMPGVDGHQLMQFLSSHWTTFDIPIIVLSCRTDAESKSCARIMGCASYIEKPFSPAELLDAIHDIDQGLHEEALIHR